MTKFEQWKLGVHLLLGTRRLGVNNSFFSSFSSLFGLSLFRILLEAILIYPLVSRYRALRWRMGKTVGFISEADYQSLFKN